MNNDGIDRIDRLGQFVNDHLGVVDDLCAFFIRQVARGDWEQQRYGRMNEISDSRREVFHGRPPFAGKEPRSLWRQIFK
jgi:hypothetical protein